MEISGAGNGDVWGESLADLLRSWRDRVDPRTVPGLVLSGRRSPGLSQYEVARLAGVSERWYRSLELGRDANFSAEFLDRLAAALQLSRAERQALYLGATGRSPDLLAHPEAGAAAGLGEELQLFLDSQSPNPAFAYDLEWNVVGCNEQLGQWLPWTPGEANVARWTFLAPDAREQLVNWREDWARPKLGQIRLARMQYPAHEGLRLLERDVLAGSPEAREMWGQREVREQFAGDVRRLRLPYHQGRVVAIRIVVLVPVRNCHVRIVVFMEVR